MGRFSQFLLPLVLAIAAPAVAMAQSVEAVRPDDRTVGSVTAPVTLTVYLSATCGHCANWHNDEFPAFRAKYVDTGQVRVAFRDLPTSPQPLAVAGVVMARCAPEDRYEAALEALFAGQTALREGGGSREAAVIWLRGAGSAAGLTLEQMNACMSSDEGFADVAARAEQSLADGVDSTPTFFLNGERILDSAMPSRSVSAFDPLIQPLLAGR